jgi:5-methylcytosine-specific restriction protein A
MQEQESPDAENPISLAEEILVDAKLPEGSLRQINISVHERNPRARRICIDHYGASCSVCDVDLGNIYGPVADGFIHVHHLTPLAEITEEYEVDPITDLRPVCPNCHAVIHIGGVVRTIEDVRKLLSE